MARLWLGLGRCSCMAIARGLQNTADTAPGSTRTTTTATYLDFSGRHWVGEAGGWIWCAPRRQRRQRRAETCGGAQVPGKEGYGGCRFCGGVDHRAVGCIPKWRATMGKLVAKMEGLQGRGWVQEEVGKIVGSRKQEQQQEQKRQGKQQRESRGARKARDDRR